MNSFRVKSCCRAVMAATLSILATFAFAPASRAATICVNPSGKGGCLTTIAAAVGAAAANDTIKVGKGTYAEDVIIDKPLSIVGAGPKKTIIDATGQGNGIYVDGIDNPGLGQIAVSGFTVKNAKYEGILVANASSVTISNNIVTDNDKSFAPPESCPGIPDFETSEDFDCGEGIHLLGANHSIVASNLVEGNAGGILITDDTARANDNLIFGNIVRGNPYDCGITLASHAPAALTGSDTPLGVMHNTVSNNLSTRNGLSEAGAGAGVGIFTSVPGAIASGNVVAYNMLTRNGLPGVAMHSHTPGQDLTNNAIESNVISGNGADTQDAATSGPAGINIFGVSAAAGTIIAGNAIRNEALDVVVNTPVNVDVHLNNLFGKGVGVQNLSTGTTNATQNWWGCPKGPGLGQCGSVSGSGTVLSVPFSATRF